MFIKMEHAKMLSLRDCETIINQCVKFETKPEIIGLSVTRREDNNFNINITIDYCQSKTTFNFFGKCVSQIPENAQDCDALPRLYLIKSKFLVYEDLSVQDFRATSSAVNSFNLEQTQKVLQSLACLHTTTQQDKPRTKLSRLEDKQLQEIVNLAANGEEVREELERRMNSLQFWRCSTHGKLLPKNILFKLDECKLTGAQPNLFEAPACDFLRVILFCSSEEVQKYHLQELIMQYYNLLSENAKKYNLGLENILPYEKFQQSVFYFLPLIKLEKVLLLEDDTSIKEFQQCVNNTKFLSKEECYIITHNNIKNQDYNLESFEVKNLENVSGFLGIYHKLTIKLKNSKTWNYFLKSTPNTGAPQALATQLKSSEREGFMYGVLIPQLLNLGIHTIKDCLPASYYQRHEDMLVFEDLSASNFHVLPSQEPFDIHLLTLSIKQLAKFHASFLVFEEKLKLRIKTEYPSYFDEPLFLENPQHLGAKTFMTGIKSLFSTNGLFTEIHTEKNQKNFYAFWPKLKILFYEVIKTSERFRNVLSHGDIWTSNIMVKHQDGKAIDCRFVDFQIIRYCPPAYDFLSILHLATHRSIRMQHEEDLKIIYYEELGKTLAEFDCDVAKVYPLNDFLECIDYMKPQMVVQAAIDCVLTMCTPEEISAFLSDEEKSNYVYFEDRTQFITDMCKQSPNFKKRLQECMLDIYDYCDLMSQ